MIKLEQIESAMRPQFVWDRFGLKPLQTSEEYEGAKDVARLLFVGIADMIGHQHNGVMEHLDMEYDSHRNKIQTFRSNYKEAMSRVESGNIFLVDDQVKRFYVKLMLCLNSIKINNYQKRFVNTENWLSYE